MKGLRYNLGASTPASDSGPVGHGAANDGDVRCAIWCERRVSRGVGPAHRQQQSAVMAVGTWHSQHAGAAASGAVVCIAQKVGFDGSIG